MPMTVKELAKTLEIKTKDVMKVLLELGSAIDGPQSFVEDEMIDKAADLTWRRFNKPEAGRFRLPSQEKPAEVKAPQSHSEPKVSQEKTETKPGPKPGAKQAAQPAKEKQPVRTERKVPQPKPVQPEV